MELLLFNFIFRLPCIQDLQMFRIKESIHQKSLNKSFPPNVVPFTFHLRLQGRVS